jgi:hypothetical protein
MAEQADRRKNGSSCEAHRLAASSLPIRAGEDRK